MNEPNDTPGIAADGTKKQSADDIERLNPKPVFNIGDVVPHRELWKLERQLGVGGFGEVWLASHLWNGQRGAIKFCTHVKARNRLIEHEMKVITRVMKHGGNHPNIVPLIDCNLTGDTPWLMYEYVEGGTLADAIDEWKALPLGRRFARVVRVMHAIASALARFHQLDPPIVHRDMKPQNVLMSGGTPRITDFGLGGAVMEILAADITAAYSGQSALLPTMLHKMGTFRYSPQEQMLGSKPNQRDDVYAMGVIAYQLVMADLKTVPGADATDELREIRLPEELITLIVKSVAINPERRPKDATEWEQRLTKLLPAPAVATVPAQAPLAPPPPPPATPSLAELALAAEADYQRGEDYYHGFGTAQDFAKAREYYQKAATQGHTESQFRLGFMHAAGEGTAVDYTKAREWYELAAAKNHVSALNNLGRLHEKGQGVPANPAKGLELYERAANLGAAGAQFNVGVMYKNGWGTQQNYKVARDWFEKAAAQAHVQALYQLGVLHENGWGVAVNLELARDWYQKAATRGHQEATQALSRLQPVVPEPDEIDFHIPGTGDSDSDSDGDFVLDEPSDVVIRIDDDEANTASPSTLAESFYQRGESYYSGDGAPQNYAQAREWFEKAATLQHPGAQFRLGTIFNEGTGVTQNYIRAREWYERAARQGHAEAQANLGVLYYFGHGVPQDYAQAKYWYEQAAEQDLVEAIYNLGTLYENGEGVIEDPLSARELYERAAAAGSGDAMYRLGELYRVGDGVLRNRDTARDYYEQALAAGNEQARDGLQLLKDEELSGALAGLKLKGRLQEDFDEDFDEVPMAMSAPVVDPFPRQVLTLILSLTLFPAMLYAGNYCLTLEGWRGVAAGGAATSAIATVWMWLLVRLRS